MAAFLSFALINALVAIPLAILAWVVGRWFQRPALTHVLWVLVLLKLVTPSPFRLPVALELPAPAPLVDIAHPDWPAASTDRADRWVHRSATPNASVAMAPPVSDQGVGTLAPAPVALRNPLSRLQFWHVLGGIWLTGSLGWFAIQIARAMRFRCRTLRNATPSPALQQQVHELAARQGLSFVPRVWLVDATVSPMLWGLGSRLRLLFPMDLSTRLDDEACATLLTHELSHYVRGDHYVRVLELLATGLFWWHPVVWWARRQIEEAEEECCDAYVLTQFPQDQRKYAEALLDTIDFLCESRAALSPMTCGLGESHFLRRRLTKIMEGDPTGMLSPRTRLALVCCMLALVLWQPLVFSSPAPDRPILAWNDIQTFNTTGSAAVSITADADLPTATTSERQSTDAPALPRSPRTNRGLQAWATAASPNGWYVVRALGNRRVILTDLRTETETDLTDQQVAAVAFAPDGKSCFIASRDGRLTQWDAASGTMLKVLGTHARGLRSVAVSPNGRDIVTGSPDGTIGMYTVAGNAEVRETRLSSQAVNCVRFSPDGHRLAVAIGDWWAPSGQILVIDVANGRTVTQQKCAAPPGALIFPSDNELIVGLWTGQTQYWNLAEGELIVTAQTNKGVVSAAAFSPDNSVLREVIFTAPGLVEETDDTQLGAAGALPPKPTGSVIVPKSLER
jgi:beta-lactamase regulating signal transducer with metallopeptidase domain